MKITDEFIQLMKTEMTKREWTAADVAKQTHSTDGTWSRIFSRTHKSISDSLLSEISIAINIPVADILAISLGLRPGLRNNGSNDHSGSATYSDRHDQLASWLRTEAPPKAIETIYNIAELAGFKDPTAKGEMCPRRSDDCPGLKKGNQNTGAA